MGNGIINTVPKKIIYYLYKSRFLGLYFCSSSERAKRVAREILVSDILCLIGAILTIAIAILLKIGVINYSSLKEYPNLRVIILTILLLFAFSIGICVDKYLKKFVRKNNLLNDFDLSAYSKYSTLPHFLLVIFGPVLFICLYVFLLKLLTYLF